MSNISPRNCRFSFSVTLVFLMTEKSVLTKPGPVTGGCELRCEYRLASKPCGRISCHSSRRGDIGTNRETDSRVDRHSGIQRIASLCLGDDADLPPGHEAVRFEWQLVKPAQDKAVADVELRRAIVTARVVCVLKDVGLAGGQGVVIERLRIGVGDNE